MKSQKICKLLGPSLGVSRSNIKLLHNSNQATRIAYKNKILLNENILIANFDGDHPETLTIIDSLPKLQNPKNIFLVDNHDNVAHILRRLHYNETYAYCHIYIINEYDILSYMYKQFFFNEIIRHSWHDKELNKIDSLYNNNLDFGDLSDYINEFVEEPLLLKE